MLDYEQILEGFYRGLLKPGDVAVDAGAHVGRHTIPIWKAVAPAGRVHAFEPAPVARAMLEKTVSVVDPPSGLVTVYPYALGERNGIDEFVIAVDNPAYSGLKTRIYDTPTRIERISVEVRRLDSVLPDIDRLDYVKIDAEGGELGILRGAASTLDRLKPVVSFEFGANSIGSYGISVQDMADFWMSTSYVLCDIRGCRLDGRQFVESATRQDVWDYLALPEDRAESIIAAWKTAQ
jgi:FkbM family methyltransferase